MNPITFIRQYLKVRKWGIPAPLTSLRPASGKYKIQRHYFLQDCWAIRKICSNINPFHRHADIGGRTDGFVGQLASAGVYVDHFDINEPPIDLPFPHLLRFYNADITNLERIQDREYKSVSCLHTLEHIGLGRYGDKLDPNAWYKAIAELTRITAIGGDLYVSVPIGWERVCFNSHRVFTAEQFEKFFSVKCDIIEYAVIDDKFALGMWHFRRAR